MFHGRQSRCLFYTSISRFHVFLSISAMIEGGIFNDIPSDPESDDGIFMESDTPLFQEISITHPISNER